MPNVVVESTWIANRKRAHEDMSMWLKGSSETTQLVILFEWEDIPCNGVKADVGVYNLDAEGNVNLLQSEVISPLFHSKILENEIQQQLTISSPGTFPSSKQAQFC